MKSNKENDKSGNGSKNLSESQNVEKYSKNHKDEWKMDEQDKKIKNKNKKDSISSNEKNKKSSHQSSIDSQKKENINEKKSPTKNSLNNIKSSLAVAKAFSPIMKPSSPTNEANLSNKTQNPWRNKLGKKRVLASRNSVSSMDSLELVRMNASPSAHKKLSNFKTASRLLIFFSLIIFIIGIVLTVLGFIDLDLSPPRQLPMQIIGPAFLMTTVVMWIVGGMFRKILSDETKNQNQLMRLRTRVQLHALAMDMYKKPQTFASQAIEDPRIRKQLLLKLRQQNAMDNR